MTSQIDAPWALFLNRLVSEILAAPKLPTHRQKRRLKIRGRLKLVARESVALVFEDATSTASCHRRGLRCLHYANLPAVGCRWEVLICRALNNNHLGVPSKHRTPFDLSTERHPAVQLTSSWIRCSFRVLLSPGECWLTQALPGLPAGQYTLALRAERVSVRVPGCQKLQTTT